MVAPGVASIRRRTRRAATPFRITVSAASALIVEGTRTRSAVATRTCSAQLPVFIRAATRCPTTRWVSWLPSCFDHPDQVVARDEREHGLAVGLAATHGLFGERHAGRLHTDPFAARFNRPEFTRPRLQYLGLPRGGEHHLERLHCGRLLRCRIGTGRFTRPGRR